MAQIQSFLPPMWETQIEFQAPGLFLAVMGIGGMKKQMEDNLSLLLISLSNK